MSPDSHSFELSLEGILVLDENWVIVAANSCARQLMHSSQQELPGSDFWDALPSQLADRHRPVAGMALKLSGEYAFVAHLEFEDQDVEYRLRREPIGVLVNLRDVTDQQETLRLGEESERRNRVLFDANPNVMWVFDVDTQKILAANDAACYFYGIASKKMLTLKLGGLFPDGEGAALYHAVGLKENHPVRSPFMLLCKQQRADGQSVLVELAANRVEWAGRPCMLVSIADVSGRHLADTHLRRLNVELERQLEQCSGELKASRRDLAAFERAMSNDLKDPLHVLNGFARTLAEKYSAVLDRQGLHYVERIQASTRHLSKLVDDLRTLTRLPRLALHWQEIDLVPLCTRLVEEIRQREPARELLLEMPGQMVVSGDRTLVAMALSHLLDNAWKFSAKKEQAWIRLGLAAGKLPGEKVVSVSDNGAGFDPEYQDKLFTAFQRLHSTADFAGNGLGLAIVRGIADRLGGSVWADSSDGPGASFFFALPPPPPVPEPVDSGGSEL